MKCNKLIKKRIVRTLTARATKTVNVNVNNAHIENHTQSQKFLFRYIISVIDWMNNAQKSLYIHCGQYYHGKNTRSDRNAKPNLMYTALSVVQNLASDDDRV